MQEITLPQSYDLRPYRGDDFLTAFLYSEVDSVTGVSLITSVTGWSAQSQVRTRPGGEVWLDLTVGQGLSLDVVAGVLEITMHILGAQTEPTTWDSRDTGVWDLQVTSPAGFKTTIVAGRFFVQPDVTRPV